MVQKLSSPFFSLLVGILMVPTLSVFSQAQDAAAHVEESTPEEETGPVEALQIILGRDSPNLGGNTFRDAFIAMTLNDTLGVEVGRIVNEISFSSTAGIAFDRASLTPDVEAAGATIEVEAGEAQGEVVTVRVTISNTGPLPDGIIANIVFTVTKEFTLEEVGNEEHLIPLENSVMAFTPDDQEIAQVLGESGGIDLAYAPVVFACFFYLH
jgi:hypothetical protein